ncbi:MAG: hypothetical protein EP329_11345 [Deltaproteobacteria bacterium]|nr:MAG: hypothetical protein EP329_11345 [Deltaproteobacteria bacterium]
MKQLSIALSLTLTLLAGLMTGQADARADEPVKFVVLLEGGIGGGARAQGYVDDLVSGFATRCGWPGATSLYTNSRDRALEYIGSDKPAFGLFSLGAYLALVDAHKLAVVGVAEAKQAGGRQYFIVAKDGDVAACRGQKLATNHAGDPRFVDHVVFAGAFRLADFELVATRRPVQTLKEVLRDKARCALIDDAQRDSMASIEGGDALKVVWSSEALPGIPIVAFPSAAKDLVGAFTKALPDTCKADAQMCSNIGIERLGTATDADYAPLVRRYHGDDAHP